MEKVRLGTANDGTPIEVDKDCLRWILGVDARPGDTLRRQDHITHTIVGSMKHNLGLCSRGWFEAVYEEVHVQVVKELLGRHDNLEWLEGRLRRLLGEDPEETGAQQV